MKISNDNLYTSSSPCVLALGCFDGVHIGHAAVISEARRISDNLGCESTVWAFGEPPRNYYFPGSAPRLTQDCEKQRLIAALGVDNFVNVTFDMTISDLSSDTFFNEIILNRLKARYVLCGFNYTFGHKAAGNVSLLRALCERAGIGFNAVLPVSVDGADVSSSVIRKMISDGNIERAGNFLGHTFSLTAEVTSGQQLARRLGFPTVNQLYPTGLTIPRRGVYISRTEIEGVTHFGITNIGIRPTIGGDTLCAETNIFGYDGNLYGRTLKIELLHFIRPEEHFETVDKLSEQVHRDIEYTKHYITAKFST